MACVTGDDSHITVVAQNHACFEKVDDGLSGLFLCRRQHERDPFHGIDLKKVQTYSFVAWSRFEAILAAMIPANGPLR